MNELICDTSPLQYLHQLRMLHLLRSLASKVIVPSAVLLELTMGRRQGVDVPSVEDYSWMVLAQPQAILPTLKRRFLGPGEIEVLALTMESSGAISVLDDRRARQTAMSLNLPFIGTGGILLEAKEAGLISSVKPFLDSLEQLGFFLTDRARTTILLRAHES